MKRKREKKKKRIIPKSERERERERKRVLFVVSPFPSDRHEQGWGKTEAGKREKVRETA